MLTYFTIGMLVVNKLTVYPYELLFMLIILAAVSFDPIIENRVLLKVISIISKGSFALYLIHPMILQIATKVWNRIGISNVILQTVYLYVTCIGVSYMLYYGIIIRIEKRFSKAVNK